MVTVTRLISHQDPQTPLRPGKLAPWWNRDALLRMLADLLQAELSRLRPGGLGLDTSLLQVLQTGPAEAPPALAALELDALQLDSLEFLDIATLTAIQFHLQQTGLDTELLQQRRLGTWVDLILESRRRWDAAISFQTSGSTGQPKLCRHAMHQLEQEIRWFADQLCDRRRLLSSVPAHHIYGFLFSVMLPAVLQIPVLDLRRGLPSSALIQARPGDLILGHPAFFALALRGQPRLAADVTLLSSTAACPAALWQQLKAAGCARMIEIYGSTETAGIGTREAAEAPFRLLPFWSRVGDKIHQQQGDLETRGVSEPVRIQDQLQWLDDQHFQVLGRRDNAVQIAGINVFPQRVERLLCSHPEVAEAAVRQASPEQGGRLKAFVVPAIACTAPETLPQRLDTWLASQVSALERPRAIRIGTQLPCASTGKLSDWDDDTPPSQAETGPRLDIGQAPKH
ncbi:MAG: 4-coumarate--CoA ligase [Halochromatium sp.]|nr:4-coumarate--CoA ligase [Halochromatium sp.]